MVVDFVSMMSLATSSIFLGAFPCNYQCNGKAIVKIISCNYDALSSFCIFTTFTCMESSLITSKSLRFINLNSFVVCFVSIKLFCLFVPHQFLHVCTVAPS